MERSSEKFLFLDFDGVLHPSSLGNGAPFSRAEFLKEVIEEFAPKVIVSSSWRFTHNLDQLTTTLPKYISKFVICATGEPIIGKYSRYTEIQRCVNDLKIIDWRALDDSHWEFPANCKELIRCNPNTGIGPKEIKMLANWLSD